jgi:hypothetical protein
MDEANGRGTLMVGGHPEIAVRNTLTDSAKPLYKSADEGRGSDRSRPAIQF